MRFCVDCEERRNSTKSRPSAVRRVNRFLRWVSVTHFLVHAFGFLGMFLHFIGVIMGFGTGNWWLAIAGSIVLSVAFTVSAREKNRSWAWGLLGVLGFIGAVFVLPLQARCERCRRLVGRDEVRCIACHGPSGFR